MNPVTRPVVVILLGVLGLIPCFARAWQAPDVQAVSCSLKHEAQGDPSPIPGWCYWDYTPGSGPHFEASTADGDGTFCTDSWRVFCRADSIGFAGAWPLMEDPYVRSIHYALDLVCSLEVTDSVRLMAYGSYDDPLLETREHTVVLKHPDGGEQILVDVDAGQTESTTDLDPGAYEIWLHVLARVGRAGTGAPYAGRLDLTWSDPAAVADEAASWGGVKARYLR